MVKNNKTALAILFSFLFAATILFVLLTVPVSAKNSSGRGVHSDITTFQKNFSLTVAQKKYAITKIKRAVSLVTNSEMSDLEKYYKLALWTNDRVTYDFDFWNITYNFDLYRHQWDAYGALADTSVCVGISILYASVCHAADLPCKFVRTYPDLLDHTINYIPDINGKAYYIDVTENGFFMSEKADNSFGSLIDKDFAYITNLCTDGTFEYGEPIGIVGEEDDMFIRSANIKDCFNRTYADWFNEYALHKNTTKNFLGDYVEKGSGTPGVHYASYRNYPKQFSATETPGLWFLEDFYKNPEEIRSKILARELDEQLVNVSYLKDCYDCEDISELETSVKCDIVIGLFPSLENGEIVPEEHSLLEDEDYTITCKSFDKSKGEAIFALEGIGDYKGTYEFPVKIKPDQVKKVKAANPMKLKGKAAAVSYSKIGKKTQIIKRAKVIRVSKAQGKLTYKYITARKGTKSFKKYFRVNTRNGRVRVRKGLKKGTYKVKVKVKAAGNTNYMASKWKTVIFKVIVK